MADETGAFTSAGTKLFVSATAPATFDQAGYEALSWTEVNDLTDMGEFGRVYADIPHKPLNSRRTHHLKGGYDDGGIQLALAWATDDAGQTIVFGFLDSDADLYCKVEFNDNPDGTTNTIDYFPGKVFGAPKAVGNVDTITTRATNIMINGLLVEVAST